MIRTYLPITMTNELKICIAQVQNNGHKELFVMIITFEWILESYKYLYVHRVDEKQLENIKQQRRNRKTIVHIVL